MPYIYQGTGTGSGGGSGGVYNYFDVPAFAVNDDMELLMDTTNDIEDYLFAVNDDGELVMIL